MSIESIKEIMDAFDPAAILPDLTTLFGKLELVCRIAVLVGPIALLIMGLAYLFLSPKEANHYCGYRCYFGMGSVQAWRFTQQAHDHAGNPLGEPPCLDGAHAEIAPVAKIMVGLLGA